MEKLSKIFGGQPEDYKQFVEENSDLKIGQTICKFAKDNNKAL